MQKEKSKTRQLIEKLLYGILTVLNENADDGLRSVEVEQRVGERVQFNEYEMGVNSQGKPRWVLNLYFYSINLVKSGYMTTNKGRWYITPAGQDAVTKMTPEQLYDAAEKGYRKWREARDKVEAATPMDGNAEPQTDTLVIEDIKGQANKELMDFVHTKTPWEFQDMVAALFRAMGYYTPFIAPKGKDGGIDIIAYSDPLGATQPIIKAQVKHYNMDNAVTVDVIRSIMGVSKSDMAVVVTSGRFAEPAKVEARLNNVRLIDGFEFCDMWIAYYNKMSEEDKTRMPIEPVYFLKREER